MMDDEPWIIEDPSETAAAEAEAAAAAAEAAAAEAAAAPAAETAQAEAAVDDALPPPPPAPRDPNKPVLCFHWTRPKFLQYNYMYDYRHNYYDDVIDYLDRRQRGLIREVPRAQTWAERALRTYASKINRSEAHRANDHDIVLLSDMKTSGSFYRYHSKAYIHRKYSTYLYR